MHKHVYIHFRCVYLNTFRCVHMFMWTHMNIHKHTHACTLIMTAILCFHSSCPLSDSLSTTKQRTPWREPWVERVGKDTSGNMAEAAGWRSLPFSTVVLATEDCHLFVVEKGYPSQGPALGVVQVAADILGYGERGRKGMKLGRCRRPLPLWLCQVYI